MTHMGGLGDIKCAQMPQTMGQLDDSWVELASKQIVCPLRDELFLTVHLYYV